MKHKIDTRRTWGRVITAALCLVLMVSAPAVAANLFDPFPIGWYDVQGTGNPPLMAADTDVVGGQGSNMTFSYYAGTDAGRIAHLDAAFAAGVGVFLEIERDLIYPTVDAAAISAFVAQWDPYPAVVGFYNYEEPYANSGEVQAQLLGAYNAIKAETVKPVLLLFGEPGIVNGKPTLWSNTYDLFAVDGYSCRVGEIEFSGMGPEPSWTGLYWDNWKNLMDMTQAESVSAGKPYWSVVQGWGDLEGETAMYRLPTNAESKFHTFYSILKEASGIIHFSYYRAKQVPAKPDEAYPYGGPTWLETVARSRNDEVNLLGPALREESIGASAVSSSDADVIGDVYQDPDTNTFYVVTAHKELGASTPTITLDLQGLPPETPVAVRPLFEGDIPPIPLTAAGTQFSDAFSSYEVHLYQVMYEPDDCADAIADGYDFVGDLDDDCDVDMDDLELFVGQWLDCVEPGGSGCQTPWVP